MYNYSLYHIVSRNILFNAIVTRMNKYIIIIEGGGGGVAPPPLKLVKVHVVSSRSQTN